MDLTLHILDDLAERLAASGAELSRRALEALALEEHKVGRITEAQVQKLLGLRRATSWMDF